MTTNQDDTDTAGSTSATARDRLDREAVFETVEPDTLETVVKLVLGVGALLFLLGLVSVLPGLDRLVPATPISATALAVALVTVAIVAVFVSAAPHVETLVEQAVGADTPLAPKAGAIAKYLVVLGAVLVAYRGFAGAVVPFLDPRGAVWLYDLAFLALALVPTALVALTLYRALDPAAAEVTQVLLPAEPDAAPATESAVESDSDASSEGDTAEDADDPESEPDAAAPAADAEADDEPSPDTDDAA